MTRITRPISPDDLRSAAAIAGCFVLAASFFVPFVWAVWL